ncbi:MAG: signal peptidase II [Opitutales bacterium]
MTATTSGEPRRPPRPLAARVWAYRHFWWLAVTVFVLDQLTKAWIVHGSGYALGVLPPASGTVVIPGVFNLIYTVNYGAAWSLGEGLGWVFVIVAVIVLAAIYRFRRALELIRLPYQVAFGLIVGGIVGNALDRVLRGHVVDFLDFDLQFYRWPTFNLADGGIVVGTCWMLLYSLLLDKPGRATNGG